MSDKKSNRLTAYFKAVGQRCSLALCGTVSVLIFALVGVMSAFGAPEIWEKTALFNLYITAAVLAALVVVAAVLLKLFDKRIGRVDNVLLIGLMSSVLVFVDLCIVGFSGAALVAWLLILGFSIALTAIRIVFFNPVEEDSASCPPAKANAGFKAYCKEFIKSQNILLLVAGAAILFGALYAFSSLGLMGDFRKTQGAVAIFALFVALLALCFAWAFWLRIRRKCVNGFDGILFIFDLAFIAISFELLSVASPTRIALFVVCLVVLAALSFFTVRATRIETAEENLVETKGGFVPYYRALAQKFDLVLWLVFPIAIFFALAILDQTGIIGTLVREAGVSRVAILVIVSIAAVIALVGLFFGLRSRKIGFMDLLLYSADVLVVLLLILQVVSGFSALKTTLWAVASAACILLTVERFRTPVLFVTAEEGEETDAEETPAAAPVEEPVLAEAVAAEAPAEEVEAEEEILVEETLAEEPAVEKLPQEEVAEEAVAAIAEEAVSADETPAEPAPIEATSAEEPAPAAAPAFASVAFSSGLPAKKDAELKLRLLPDAVKGYYGEIKNALLSFGLRARMSKTCEKFNRRGTTMSRLDAEKPVRTQAVIQVRGKSLCLYLNLDPATIEAKYFAKDVSGVKKFVDTPALLKIRSARAAKRAFELIERLAEQEGFKPKRRFVPVDYLPGLSAEGLTTFEKNGYGYLISETAKLSEVRKLDDSLAIKNISVDPEIELAERFIRSRVTVKEIADAFEAGSTITISDLREREMITSNANYLIVTESESLSGKFTVVANEFTPDAAKLIQVAGGEAVKKPIQLIGE